MMLKTRPLNARPHKNTEPTSSLWRLVAFVLLPSLFLFCVCIWCGVAKDTAALVSFASVLILSSLVIAAILLAFLYLCTIFSVIFSCGKISPFRIFVDCILAMFGLHKAEVEPKSLDQAFAMSQSVRKAPKESPKKSWRLHITDKGIFCLQSQNDANSQ